MSCSSILEKYADLFPDNKLCHDSFIDDLLEIKKNRDPRALLDYWEKLKSEGTMDNILVSFDRKEHDKIKILIYSMAEFLNISEYTEFKKKLDIHGHILEFVFAIFSKDSPNLDIIRYFITVAKNPRHYSPSVIKWFYSYVSPLIIDDTALHEQFVENCTLAVQRWVNTNQRNSYVKRKKKIDPLLYKFIPMHKLPEGLI